MDGLSLDLRKQQLEKLRSAFPEAISEQGIDWEKLRLTLGDDIALTNERYMLNWAGKSDAFRAIQTPTTATLKLQRAQSLEFDTTRNIFIEGENLEVLKVLQKAYYGKVKMIYIDPPYNTGNDSFIYPDKFSESKEEYLKRIGDKDEAGYLTKEGFFRKNSKENGQFHSNWLSMMYPRLFLARNLLRNDGVIFVSIDDNEVHNLRLMMNEIFGEESFVEQIVWKNKYGSGALTKGFANVHEYLLCYSKHEFQSIEAPLDEETIKQYKNRDAKYPTRGGYITQPLATTSKDERPNLRYPIIHKGATIWPDKQWIWSKERFEEAYANDEIVITETEGKYSVRMKQYLRDENGNLRRAKPISILNGPFNQDGTKEVKELIGDGIFDFPKPSALLKYLCSFVVNEKDDKAGIYLDFFGGSGSLAHAILDLNRLDGGTRRFILAQLPETTEEESEAHKAGYKTIADICKERIKRASKKIKEEVEAQPDLFKDKPLDLGFNVFTLEPSNFKVWRTDVIETEEELKKQMQVFVDPVRARSEADDMAWEILLKSGYELTTPVEKIDLAGVSVYSIADGELVLILETVTQGAIGSVLARKPQRVICLDRLFAGNDQLKTNTVLQMKDEGVEFRTI